MCGICGFVSFDGHRPDEARAAVSRMNQTLVHRGPDAEGTYVDGHAALGHRRLAIIDLSGGAQPMSTPDGRFHVVFNGEIYNFPDLRRELEALGHRFRTRSDTEVILHGYRQWGPAVPERLHGMFAFAVWDRDERTLFLARDRVGKKPLYWCWDGRVFWFASEIKALRAGGAGPFELDLEALDDYLCLGYVPAPKTIHRQVRKLRPGHTLTVGSNGPAERPYWRIEFGPVEPWSPEEAAERLEALLREAVRRRLISEVPLGAFLSGGLDSTLVVSFMARELDAPVLTNSIGFREREYSELPVARAVAEHVGADHREFVVEPRAAEVIDSIAWHFDEPFADSSAVPTWYVCQMARRNVTVALSGDGGDEGFGGYTFRYVPHLAESRVRARLPAWLRGPVFGALGALWPASARLPRPLRLKTIWQNLAVSDAEAFHRDLVWLLPEARQHLYRPEFLEALRGYSPQEVSWPLYTGSSASDPVGRAQHTDIRLYMTDDVLVKVDRMSMAHSLEVRCPLLDHRVLEFAARLPLRCRLDGRRGKVLLRRLARRHLPAEVLDQPKRGFSIPAAQWLRGELRERVEDALARPDGMVHAFLRPGRLRGLWRQHLSGGRDHSVLFWGLMMLDLWARTHRGSPLADPACTG